LLGARSKRPRDRRTAEKRDELACPLEQDLFSAPASPAARTIESKSRSAAHTAGLELIEIAPGIDPEKDILPHMGFQPIMRDPRSMNPLIFKPEPMGLERLLLGLSLSERITYDQARNTIFINFEGFQVGTTADVDLVRREIEARCKAIGGTCRQL